MKSTSEAAQKSIAVIGGAGYIGSVLTRLALSMGYKVKVFDMFFFGKNLDSHQNLSLIKMDNRLIKSADLDGVDFVFDLAAISNDPAGELNTQTTMDINFRGRKNVQSVAAEVGVSKYVLASSCSVYGFQEGICNEQTVPNPLTAYAEANLLSEQHTLNFSNSETSFVCARQATVFGLSSRMRFDLAVNGMTKSLFETGKLSMQRDGEQSRPLIHIYDLAKALMLLAQSSVSFEKNIVNVGFNDLNMKIRDIGSRVISEVSENAEIEWYGAADHRSYEVDFSKFENQFWGDSDHLTVEQGAREIYGALTSGLADTSLRSMTLPWYQQNHSYIFRDQGTVTD